MTAKRMVLNQSTFFVLSGISNPLGKTMAMEICRRLQRKSLVLLIDECEERLQALKKELQYLESGSQIEVFIGVVGDWKQATAEQLRQLIVDTLLISMKKDINGNTFELAFMLHNEGTAATRQMLEPQNTQAWLDYTQQHVYAPIALNRAFVECTALQGIPKLVVNVSSSLDVQPFVYSSLLCSCKKARDMYFRSMASVEGRNGVVVLTYSPGILETHQPQYDVNNNVVDLLDLRVDAKLLEMPRVQPLQSTLKLINILEEISFISGHDVDYYDTYVL